MLVHPFAAIPTTDELVNVISEFPKCSLCWLETSCCPVHMGSCLALCEESVHIVKGNHRNHTEDKAGPQTAGSMSAEIWRRPESVPNNIWGREGLVAPGMGVWCTWDRETAGAVPRRQVSETWLRDLDDFSKLLCLLGTILGVIEEPEITSHRWGMWLGSECNSCSMAFLKDLA